MKKFRYDISESTIYFLHLPELKTAGYYRKEFNKYIFYEYLKCESLHKNKNSILYMGIISR